MHGLKSRYTIKLQLIKSGAIFFVVNIYFFEDKTKDRLFVFQ